MLLRFIAFILFSTAILNNSYSQVVKIDSLQTLIKGSPDDTAKVIMLNQLVISLRESDNTKALLYANTAIALAEKLKFEKGKAASLENIGWIHYRKGDYSKAFECSTEALKISEAHNHIPAIARCLNNIAAIQLEQKQIASAIENLKKAYALSKHSDDKWAMARSLNNIAFSFYSLPNFDSAMVYAWQGLKMSERSKDPYLIGYAFRNLGDLDFEKGNYRSALHKYWQVLALAAPVQNRFLEVSTLHKLSSTYIKLNDADKAEHYLLQNIALAQQFGYLEELEHSYKILSEVYIERQQLPKAIEYQSKYIAMHDSLYNQRRTEELALQQARFDSEIKEAKIALLTKDTQLKQEEINQQRAWMYFYLGCLSMLIILAFVLLYHNKLRKKVNESLEAKRDEIQLQALQLSNLNATKDKLFSIISHDLRSPLASLRGLIDLVITGDLTHKEFCEVSKKLKINLETVNEDLENLLLWAQSQLKGLHVNQERVYVKHLLDQKINLYREISRSKGITILNEIEEDLLVLADKNHLGLVIRNILGNAIKFNRQGGLITIHQNEVNDHIEISITDSGVGMEISDLKKLFNAETHFTNPGTNHEKGAGIGLLLAKEFIEKNGGAIWVTSELGKGSTFTFTLKREHTLVSLHAYR